MRHSSFVVANTVAMMTETDYSPRTWLSISLYLVILMAFSMSSKFQWLNWKVDILLSEIGIVLSLWGVTVVYTVLSVNVYSLCYMIQIQTVLLITRPHSYIERTGGSMKRKWLRSSKPAGMMTISNMCSEVLLYRYSAHRPVSGQVVF
jgi:hypothetical protein